LTWKGPRLDAVTKSRKELELPLAVAPATLAHSADQLNAILLALGFTTAGVVRKTRRSTVVHFEGQAVTCCLDQVQGLPWYAELELLCAEADRQQATELLLRLAQILELHQSERRSYLELVQIAARDSAATV
jgi:adenylate cyclase class 2